MRFLLKEFLTPDSSAFKKYFYKLFVFLDDTIGPSVRASEMAVLLCGIYHTYTYYSSYTHTHKYILMQFTESLYIYLHSSLLCLLSLFSCGKLKGSTNKSDYKIAQTFNPSSSFHLHATNLFLFCFFALLLGHSILHQ